MTVELSKETIMLQANDTLQIKFVHSDYYAKRKW
jgi:hypothetical protein